MEIDFASSRIQRDCCTFAAMKKKFGERQAEVLNTRFKQLRAASNLEELRHAPGGWHELTGDRKGQIAATVVQGRRLIVIPTEDPPPTQGSIYRADGGLDWTQITAVTVVEIVDYH